MNHETVRRQMHGGSAVSLAFVAAAAARNHTSIDWVVWGRSASDGADEDRELRLAHVERRLDRAAAAVRDLARDVARARREHEGRRR